MYLLFDLLWVSMIDCGDGEVVWFDGMCFLVGFSCFLLCDVEGVVCGSLVLFQDLIEFS